MNALNYYGICLIGMVIFTIAYLKIAKALKIHDHPVSRSSHTVVTITGFGLFLPMGLLIYTVCYSYNTLPVLFVVGFLMMVTISFIDDIIFIKHAIRFVFQIFSLILMASVLPFENGFADTLPVVIAVVIFSIGVLNAFNFMDGVNGMLGLNSLVIFLSLWWLNENSFDKEGAHIYYTDSVFLVTCIIGLCMFLFLNFRKKALVFAGDIGSIGIAFIICYMMFSLILKTGNYSYLLLFSVLGVDAGLTVIYKLILRENIFVPHRDFLFKKLAHVAKAPHIRISFIYAMIQLVINVIVIFQPYQKKLSSQLAVMFIIVVLLLATYIGFRNQYTKKRIIRFRDKE
ncbi:MAG: hypothetical protein H7321_02540 [Bacteroidia bacterium]|nr:hypothetical protein [Bacteroidia bacterium]